MNVDKYHFSDFTLDSYREIIRKAKLLYDFKFYDSYDFNRNFVLWRHDVDCSLEYSLELAKIEADEFVQSTYFILIHSEYYSPFEKKSFDIIKHILALGHKIGVHFDSSFYNILTEKELLDRLAFEKGILENLFETEINVFSFHNPTSFELSSFRKYMYADCINTYSDIFQEKIAYCSDSNGYWRHNRLLNMLNENVPFLQVLLHPEWWQEKIRSPKERIMKIIKDRHDESVLGYNNLLFENGRENVDW